MEAKHSGPLSLKRPLAYLYCAEKHPFYGRQCVEVWRRRGLLPPNLGCAA